MGYTRGFAGISPRNALLQVSALRLCLLPKQDMHDQGETYGNPSEARQRTTDACGCRKSSRCGYHYGVARAARSRACLKRIAAAQAMGDSYLLPSIAAVVLGGTSILGGRGSYLGTVAGVILITLLQSILSVMQMPEAGRQIVYGMVIIAMLLLYGRSAANR